MSITIDNGWNGFEGIARRVDGGWEYECDGMPTMMGCGGHITITRKWTRVGKKKSGWLVCYGLEPKPEFGGEAEFQNPGHWQDDHDVVLTFCPSCAKVVQKKP